MFAHEPAVLRWLASVAPQRVPAVLAADDDTGRTLLAHAPGEDRYFAPPTEVADLIDDLHHIQRAAVAHIEWLRAAGVPDKRWPVLARRIRNTVARHDPDLRPPLNAALRSLVDSLEERFAAIDACGLPDTLGHGDFHAGNARSDGTRRMLIDWGDSFVGHPGFDALRIVERQPPDAAARLLTHWANRWRATAPGCHPERALELLAPVAALSGGDLRGLPVRDRTVRTPLPRRGHRHPAPCGGHPKTATTAGLPWPAATPAAGLVRWIQGDASGIGAAEYDLVVMSGHVVQVITDDRALLATFTAIRRALRPRGILAFDSRNPVARAWTRWTPDQSRRILAGGVEVWFQDRQARGYAVTTEIHYRFPHRRGAGLPRRTSVSLVRVAVPGADRHRFPGRPGRP
jgi:Phosphotransferase enzyme family